VAWALIALFAGVAILLGRRSLLRRDVLGRALSVKRIAVALYVVVPPAIIAGLYDSETIDTFSYLATANVLLLALSSWTTEALASREAARASTIGLACTALAAHAAVGYLALDRAGQILSLS
jgi:hypothetical protein